ncbi:MAG: DUF86 domain-containing protein [Rhodocyclales bacterium]|nr:DUF86 domain-containing protein [Rhodocyclales bacterium]
MNQALRDADYLEHIQDAIARIGRYTADKVEADFLGNELIQDGVIRNLEIIGEAVTKLSPELKARYAGVPWGENPGCETIHGYISVNLEIVWSTVQKVVPDFLGKITDIQRELGLPPQ